MAEINIVPYIDVMLVLLVVFMITAPLINQGVEIDLPQAPSNPMPPNEAFPITLHVDRAGTYFLELEEGLEPVEDPAQLVTRVAAILRVRPDTPIFVRADKSVDYGAVVRGMNWLQQAGAGRIGLATDRPEV